MSDRLQALREQGAQRLDPTRFHYLEVLASRLPEAPERVRPTLEDKLQEAVAEYEARFAQAADAARGQVAELFAARPELARELRRLFKAGDFKALGKLRPSAPRPMAELNRHIRGVTGQDADAEMKSVRRFFEVWSRMAAVDQVEQAVGRGPEKAGPLNSHMLVLNSLALMRTLSPSYLRRFLSHVDTLLWLDQQGQKPMPVEAKAKPPAARRARPKK
ncbi:hypothetical protein RD110_22880 [Rhodoferax koreense]|uniref:DUF2894 domain-containing protein n=1 Tax=Rhodoferax koreensis TaxID=1842727 RepID=A0A1P8K122_9BURK|nr:DUF2894 domain-containing protein [Rhodoferax koreense]APW39696.1 hypothetical protein RD110_22880 [Rhodoferax koreense]